jgi:hypothetical protein
MRALLVVAVVAALAGVASADAYKDDLVAEHAAMQAALKKACPARAAEIDKLDPQQSRADQLGPLTKLSACGAKNETFLQTLGSLYIDAGEFAKSEAAFRKVLALHVTEAGQVGLLIALSRQDKLSTKQKADVKKNLAYFAGHPCRRADLCVGLAYAAWHFEDITLTRSAADAGIALGFEGWQPYFFGGVAYAVTPDQDRAKARQLLTEAKKRGAPAADVDGFLHDLGAS